jgi:hypothetical protein
MGATNETEDAEKKQSHSIQVERVLNREELVELIADAHIRYSPKK